MKSKLEEKKLELAEKHSNEVYDPNSLDPDYSEEDFKAGFDAGVSAYKEMLEGDIEKIKDALIFVNGYLGLLNKTSVISDWRINDMRDKLEGMTKDIEVLK
jgi:hypothetical protein